MSIKVELVGKFFDNQSLSIVNRELALELSKKIDLYVSPIDEFDWKHKVDIDKVKAIKDLANKELTTPPDIQLRHSYPVIWNWPVSKHTKVVYIQPWEFSKIPSEWQYKFDTFADALITPSTWCTAVYQAAGINPEKIYTIPNGVDFEVNLSPVRNFNTRTNFLFIGNPQFRKGLDILIQAWVRAFSKVDNVSLTIKDSPLIYGQSNTLEDIIKIQYFNKCAPIKYNDSNLSQKEVADLYRSHDILVHPYRGEGFGMHVTEAMVAGCLPLVTAGGSTDDFVIQDEFKIPSGKRIVNFYDIFAGKPGDSFSNMGAHSWVLEPDINILIEKMKNIHEVKSGLKVDLSRLQSWSQIAEHYAAVMTQISASDIPVRLQ